MDGEGAPGYWFSSGPCGILLGACNACVLVPRSCAVSRKACLGMASHSLPKHHVTFPIPAR